MPDAMPTHIKPMLARPTHRLPVNQDDWAFEVKWDGVRAIAYVGPEGLRLESRSLRDITASYPELSRLAEALGGHEAVLDGEIVAFGDDGRPSFPRLQRRMHVTGRGAVAALAAEIPVVYAIFDLLGIDGEQLLAVGYQERRRRLEELDLNGPAWRVPAAHVGPDAGEKLMQATLGGGLEGVVAKRLGSRYEPGGRNGSWLKLKHTRRQELVIGGWLPGEGRRRDRIGALLMGYHDEAGNLRYAGRVGSGFDEPMLARLAGMLAPLTRDASPFIEAPKLPREAMFVEPELVAEVEFTEWTPDGVMRAPVFKGLLDDRPPAPVVSVKEPAPGGARVTDPGSSQTQPGGPTLAATWPPKSPLKAGSTISAKPIKTLEELPGGGRVVEVEGRRLQLSNWDKVLFPDAGFTKGDLIEFYAGVAPAVLPHVRDRALTLKRYPNGVQSPYFYEKQSPSHRPDWVATASIGGVDYTVVGERATLVWLANLADVELHTSLALAAAPQRPTLLVFDLDPGAPAGIVECCEVGVVLRGMFDALGLVTCAKTSGSKGLQVYVPLGDDSVTYSQTKALARRIAELLESRMPELVVSRMTKRLRGGRVLVDWSQNDAHKTTVTAYSVRALPSPGVSTPVSWEEVESCRRSRDASSLHFTPEQVLRRARELGDLFAPVANVHQPLPAL